MSDIQALEAGKEKPTVMHLDADVSGKKEYDGKSGETELKSTTLATSISIAPLYRPKAIALFVWIAAVLGAGGFLVYWFLLESDDNDLPQRNKAHVFRSYVQDSSLPSKEKWGNLTLQIVRSTYSSTAFPTDPYRNDFDDNGRYKEQYKLEQLNLAPNTEYRFCFQEIGGSSQCQGNRFTGWSIAPVFGDYDLDNRPGGCTYGSSWCRPTSRTTQVIYLGSYHSNNISQPRHLKGFVLKELSASFC